MGDWKLVTAAGAKDALFHLSIDPGEKTDFSKTEPDRVKKLQAKWKAWSSQLMEPKWGRRGKDKED
jgi:hypothetical protein